MKKRGITWRVRKFLNKPGYHSIAFVYIEINKDSVKFKLGDCDRVINLEFDGYGPEGKANALQKARTLAQVTAEFADKLELHFASGGDADNW